MVLHPLPAGLQGISAYFQSIATGRKTKEEKAGVDVIIKNFVEKSIEKRQQVMDKNDIYRWIHILIINCCRFLTLGIHHDSSLQVKYKCIMDKI
jgi:hypothetical protein